MVGQASMHHPILWIVLFLAAAFQGYVTFRVWRTGMFSRREKANQTKLVWLVPIFGAAVVFAFLSEEEQGSRSDAPRSEVPRDRS